MHHRLMATCVIIGLLGSAAPAAIAAKAQPPTTWDGLSVVKAKRFDHAYLLPGADFRTYSKVMLDPTEVSFVKDLVRDHNRDAAGLSGRINDADARKMLETFRTGFEEIFRKAYGDAGYEIVSEPGPDVLRVRTAVANLYVTAPDRPTAGRTRVYGRTAGSALVVVEARDSLSGALLGRAVDSRSTGDMGPYIRNSVTNRAAFASMFRNWAKISIDGLAELKARSPVEIADAPGR